MDKTTQDMKVGPLNSDYTRGYLDGKKAGATAENERAQKMADVLDKIKTWHSPGHSAAWAILHIKNIAIQALEQWKGTGKEVTDPCPYCGKELSRDRNLCCRECGKEAER